MMIKYPVYRRKISRVYKCTLWVIGIFLISVSYAQESNEYLKVNSLSPRLAVFSGGIQNVNNIAINTDEGIIVIDAGDSKEHGLKLREAIIRHFGKDNFLFLINTHYHSDHTGGDPAFPDAKCIAHKNFRIFIKDGSGQIPDQSQYYKKPEKKEGKDLPPPPPASSLNSFPYITVDEISEVGQDEILSAVPDTVFDQKLILNAGNIEVILLYYGKAHTESDIWVYVPGEGVLCTGDLFMKDLVPGFKGMDVESWLAAFDFILNEENGELNYVIPGHYGIIDPDQFAAYRDYIQTMYFGIEEDVESGMSLNDLNSKYSLENAFPGLVHCDVQDNHGNSAHEGNIKRLFDYFNK